MLENDVAEKADDCQQDGYNYKDGSAREHSEMVRSMDAYEKGAKIRLDAMVTVYDSRKCEQGFLYGLIPRDNILHPRFDPAEVWEIIGTLEATLETIRIEEDFFGKPGFAAWSRRHAR